MTKHTDIRELLKDAAPFGERESFVACIALKDDHRIFPVGDDFSKEELKTLEVMQRFIDSLDDHVIAYYYARVANAHWRGKNYSDHKPGDTWQWARLDIEECPLDDKRSEAYLFACRDIKFSMDQIPVAIRNYLTDDKACDLKNPGGFLSDYLIRQKDKLSRTKAAWMPAPTSEAEQSAKLRAVSNELPDDDVLRLFADFAEDMENLKNHPNASK